MLNKILILFFLIGSIATAQNPYEQFGFDNTELETEMEKLKSNNFILVNTDTTSNISALKFDFNVAKVIIVYNNGFVHEKLIPKEMVLRWLSVDPKADQFPHQSPYLSMDGNPILNIDPNGESTITANDGTVIEVNNDKDLGVYKSDLKLGEYGPIPKKNDLEKMGETEFWNEFIEPEGENEGKVVGRIMFNESFDNIIKELSIEADNMDLNEIQNQSKPKQKFDIKNKKEYAPYGHYIGKKINGKYYTARSAGNYLAGYNASGSSYLGITISFKTFQKIAGALHVNKSVSYSEISDILLYGRQYGPAPTYGENYYQYRLSKKGWDDKKAQIKIKNANEIEKTLKNNIGPKW